MPVGDSESRHVDSTRPNASPYSSAVARANQLADKLAYMIGHAGFMYQPYFGSQVTLARKVVRGSKVMEVTVTGTDGRTISGTIYE